MRATPPVRRSQVPAFTLIEILVVAAIIALLIAILIPSMTAAKRQAKAVQCMTNLRQIGQGFQTYSVQWKEVVPAPLYIDYLAKGLPKPEWPWQAMLWKYLVQKRPLPSDFKGNNRFSYLRKTLFICPRAEVFDGWMLNEDVQKYSYSMNANLPAAPQLRVIAGPALESNEFKTLAKVKTPSEALLAADGVAVSVSATSAGNKSMIGGPSTSVFDMAARSDQQNRHSGRVHCLKCDGSVSPYRWVEPSWSIAFSLERWQKSVRGIIDIPMPPHDSDKMKPETWSQRAQLFWYGRVFPR